MNELVAICRAARELLATGQAGWLATVLHVRGSAFRQPGARLLFTAGRALAGSVSGGCLENDIVRRGPWLSEAGPRLLTYDARTGDEDGDRTGTGCDGAIDILVEQLDERLISFIERCLASEQRGVVLTCARSGLPSLTVGARTFVDAEGQPTGETPLLDTAWGAELERAAREVLEARSSRYHELLPGTEILVELVQPPPRLFVFGGGPDALWLVRLAQSVGFGVTVCTTAPRFTVQAQLVGLDEIDYVAPTQAAEALEACAAPLGVVMTHSLQNDREALAALLSSRAQYIGVLGPARRCARLLSELGQEAPALRHGQPKRVYGPAGLHLGGSSPAEVAFSILAEAQAVFHGASARSLRERKLPIHTALTVSRPTLRWAEGT